MTKTKQPRARNRSVVVALTLTALTITACAERESAPNAFLESLHPCSIALAPHKGAAPIDARIRQAQAKARESAHPVAALERVGWLFVSKARTAGDPGYLKLAEEVSLCMDSKQPEAASALLLRGHVLHNLHRFKEAEAVARQLLATRQAPFDYGLLGDTLMEQGKLEEAARAYQRMIDLKPSPHSYLRAAHLRWLKGDLAGAIPVMRMAARASGPRDSESAAWIYTRLSTLELQSGNLNKALLAAEVALGFQPDYAPALFAKGRVLPAQRKDEEALAVLTRAASRNPLPEYQWLLADTLRRIDRLEEADQVETLLKKSGRTRDPRTLALFLATRGEDTEDALRLARQELEARGDIFTFDALAWALHSAGRTEDARGAIAKALAEGTEDARLFYHAAAIAAAAGRRGEAAVWTQRSHAIRQMLYPSERRQLAALRADLIQTKTSL